MNEKSRFAPCHQLGPQIRLNWQL